MIYLTSKNKLIYFNGESDIGLLLCHLRRCLGLFAVIKSILAGVIDTPLMPLPCPTVLHIYGIAFEWDEDGYEIAVPVIGHFSIHFHFSFMRTFRPVYRAFRKDIILIASILLLPATRVVGTCLIQLVEERLLERLSRDELDFHFACIEVFIIGRIGGNYVGEIHSRNLSEVCCAMIWY